MSDVLGDIDTGAPATLAALAARLIPAAHGMPSAGDVIDDRRLRFVLEARPDLSSRCVPHSAPACRTIPPRAWPRWSATSRTSTRPCCS